MSFSINKLARAFFATVILAVSSFANAGPVSVATDFSVTNFSFDLGNGFGNASNRLGVDFTTAALPKSFKLNELGEFSFDFATVTLRETCINGPKSPCTSGNGNETANLGVTANFIFANPIKTKASSVAVTGAFVGDVSDNAPDFIIDFTPVQFAFGTYGMFEIDLSDAVFSKVDQSKVLKATVTLLAADVKPRNTGEVPEPGSLALMGLAFAGLALFGRRKQ